MNAKTTIEPADETASAAKSAPDRALLEKTATDLKQSAEKAIETTRQGARDAARRTAEGIDSNPLSVLVGGVALGVLAGALIPRTDQEGKVLGPVGKRLTDTAKSAASAARDAGKAELDAIGLNKDAAREQAGKLLDGVIKALSSAGAAAAKASSGGGASE